MSIATGAATIGSLPSLASDVGSVRLAEIRRAKWEELGREIDSVEFRDALSRYFDPSRAKMRGASSTQFL